MKNRKNKLYCVLSFLLLLLVLCAVLYLAFRVVLFYISWCQSSKTASMGGWILSATWLLVPALLICLILFVKSLQIWKEKVVHNGKWCILHDWDGCTCRYCGAHRNEGHHWKQCVCTSCGKTRHSIDKNCQCTECGLVFHDPVAVEEKAAGSGDSGGALETHQVCRRCGKRLS